MNTITPPAATRVIHATNAALAVAKSPIYGFGALQQIRCDERPNPAALRDRFVISRLGPNDVLISFLTMPSRSSAENRIVSELESVIKGVSQTAGDVPLGRLTCFLNRRFVELKEDYLKESKRHRTEGFFCAQLDIRNRTLRYSNAGLHALVVRSQGRIESLYDGGPPLGMGRDVGYFEGKVSMDEPADALIVFDDGFGRATTAGQLVSFISAHCNAGCRGFWSRLISEWCNGGWTSTVEDASLLVLKSVDGSDGEITNIDGNERDWHVYESRKIGDDILVRGSYRKMAIED